MSLLDKINFFNSVDRKGRREDGDIASEYPAFYFPTHLRELRDEVAKAEQQIELNLVPPSELPYAKNDLKRSKKRLEEIENSMPKIKGKEKDEMAALYKSLEGQISDSMYSRTQMKKGLADVHEEARRMSEPIIKIGIEGKFFENMGIKPVDGKITRNQASRAYKIMGRVLEANTNIEALRKDYNTGTTQFEKSLRELIGEES